ncbi:MAG: aminotransferase class V-fold PLP-dependent enzyme [Clostridia bacterium]|nr:aminotransferase class V-fold PLP-dependent enzyme [Clostridia bacterium]
MNTPIRDFIENYIKSDSARFHMPGHKGRGKAEKMDITEISGADSLYEASGIIAESEANAGSIFGADTFYSTEGSSLAIRAMLYLAAVCCRTEQEKYILAGRNAHKAFISAAALLDLGVKWLYPSETDSYLSCKISPDELDKALSACAQKPAAVYITSPDYLGNISDVAGLSSVCRKHGVPLLVDNAHGAYLKFLSSSLHPMDLGADMCCDSAHKTLPVLTGGAYLHISKSANPEFKEKAKAALALFGSTSPSYLIMQSLDYANPLLVSDFSAKVAEAAACIQKIKSALKDKGYILLGDEPLKITIKAKPFGYTGDELANILRKEKIECEFCDNDLLVLMLSPANSLRQLKKLQKVLLATEKREPIRTSPPETAKCDAVLSPHVAALSDWEEIAAEQSEGRILAMANLSCPPAVPIVSCGERIDSKAIENFIYYGIKTCRVVK